LWTVPTFGLFISSVRPENEIKGNGWWNFFLHPSFTLENYNQVLFGTSNTNGRLASYFVNSIVITIPSVLFPILFCSLAAYALAWTNFRGRDWIYLGIFALQIVPLQMSLVPLLSFFSKGVNVGGLQLLPAWDLQGPDKFIQVWFAHTCFALPLGIFLLHNFISEIPGEVIEAARVDGAGHSTIFWRIILPLSVPALASLAIFQFLWVWNDLLVALVFSGGTADVAPITQRLAEISGTRGARDYLNPAAAFVSIIIPLLVFFGLQRYFVRGLLSGGLKG